MKFTQIPTNTFSTIQINAGVICSEFTPATGTVTGIIGATSGGNTFNSNPAFVDFGEDVDNVPPRTMQLQRIQYYDPTLTTTFVAADTDLGKMLQAAADVDGSNTAHLIPRTALSTDDFDDLWLVGDYSDKNGATNGGYIAIHIKNALNTGGFQWQTTKDGKGQFSAEFHGHYDLTNIDNQPFEIYIKAGTAEPT